VTLYLASIDKNFLVQAINNKSELFDEPYQKIFKKDITARDVCLAWIVGGMADIERQKHFEKIKRDSNSNLLGVSAAYWVVFTTFKLFHKLTDIRSPQITLERMKAVEFQNAVRKYVLHAVELFYEVGVDTHDPDTYGSFKSKLRSAKYLDKVDSKLSSRIARIPQKKLPDLPAVCKAIKKI